MKGTYELLVYAPADWVVLSTSENKAPSDKGTFDFQASSAHFNIDKELYEVFGADPIRCWQFEESYKLSTYLYSLMAGPYKEFVDENPSPIRQRIFAR